jgi:hypothetical protein
VSVGVADVNGDGVADIITGAGPGGGPLVRVFSLVGGLTELASFYAYDPGFTKGIFVAGGDVNGDGKAEIVTGTYQEGGPVRVFDVGPLGVSELTSFFAYFSKFQGPVRVAVADVNGDGIGDIITGAGPGGGPHVQAFSLAGGGLSALASFYAYDPAFCDVGSSPDPVVCDGVFVSGADVTGDGVAEIITGTNQTEGPVRIFRVGAGGVTELTHFFAYFSLFKGPVRVAATDANDPRPNSAGSSWVSGREDWAEPSGRHGLASTSVILATGAFLNRDSMPPSGRGPPRDPVTYASSSAKAESKDEHQQERADRCISQHHDRGGCPDHLRMLFVGPNGTPRFPTLVSTVLSQSAPLFGGKQPDSRSRRRSANAYR